MRQLVCLATWPDGADARRVRFKLPSTAFSQGAASRSRSIPFLLLTFQLHENSKSKCCSKVASDLAANFQEARLQPQSTAHQQAGRIQFPAAPGGFRRAIRADERLFTMNVTTIVLIPG